MKRFLMILIVLAVASAAVFANGTNELAGTGGGPPAGRGMGGGRGAGTGVGGGLAGEPGAYEDLSVLIADIPAAPLSEAEIEGLVYMREEEKLARDVYAALYEIWNVPVFSSIARSEAQHMDSVAELLDRYDLEDPISANDEPGVFTDPVLQSLYDELVEQGRASLTDAMTVGATIEDLDIFDLQQQIAASDNDDLRIIYQNLMKGSRNHMRSFVAQLERLGADYDAQYVSAEYLQEVLAIAREVAPITDPEYVM
jgi:hypothetical protein